MTWTSNAAGRPRLQVGRKTSAGLERESGIKFGISLEGAKAADWAALKTTSRMTVTLLAQAVATEEFFAGTDGFCCVYPTGFCAGTMSDTEVDEAAPFNKVQCDWLQSFIRTQTGLPQPQEGQATTSDTVLPGSTAQTPTPPPSGELVSNNNYVGSGNRPEAASYATPYNMVRPLATWHDRTCRFHTVAVAPNGARIPDGRRCSPATGWPGRAGRPRP